MFRFADAMAVTAGIATVPPGGRNGTGAHVAQLAELGLENGATVFEVEQGIGQVMPPSVNYARFKTRGCPRMLMFPRCFQMFPVLTDCGKLWYTL